MNVQSECFSLFSTKTVPVWWMLICQSALVSSQKQRVRGNSLRCAFAWHLLQPQRHASYWSTSRNVSHMHSSIFQFDMWILFIPSQLFRLVHQFHNSLIASPMLFYCLQQFSLFSKLSSFSRYGHKSLVAMFRFAFAKLQFNCAQPSRIALCGHCFQSFLSLLLLVSLEHIIILSFLL